jgi:hypothetical protein
MTRGLPGAASKMLALQVFARSRESAFAAGLPFCRGPGASPQRSHDFLNRTSDAKLSEGASFAHTHRKRKSPS